MAENEKEKPKCFTLCTKVNPIPQRYLHIMFGVLCSCTAYLLRHCINVTITQIVAPRNYSAKVLKSQAVCKADVGFNNKKNTGTRNWSQQMQSYILGTFYIGYFIAHFPAGFLADRFGAKWVLFVDVAVASTITAFTPIGLEEGGKHAYIALRVLLGLAQGPTYPALTVLLADWIPPRERAVCGTLIFTGGNMGFVVSNTISAWILKYHFWHVVFYVWAIVGFVWATNFAIFTTSSPARHPCIREKEIEHLQEAMGPRKERKNLARTPLKAIFTSVPVWCCIAAQVGHSWSIFMLPVYLPKYMNDVLQLRIEKTGIYASLPSICLVVCGVSAGAISDWLISSKRMTTTAARKMMTGIASFGPSIFLMAASYSGCNKTLVVSMFCMSMGLKGTFFAGMKVAVIDMSPNYAGFIMSTANGLGAICGFISPVIAGWLTPNTTIREWRMAFWVTSAILCITGIIFILWADCTLQPWNDPENEKKNTEGKTS